MAAPNAHALPSCKQVVKGFLYALEAEAGEARGGGGSSVVQLVLGHVRIRPCAWLGCYLLDQILGLFCR